MRFRMIVFICFIVAMMAVFALRLYKLQTAELVTADADSMTYRTTMEASRGNILDRNGNVLVSNRASYNLVIINFVLTNTGATNENLLKLLDLCDQLGIEYESHFPVTMERPYAYQMDGIYYIKVWLNEGELTVGDDIMYVLIGGDIRPHVVDALQALVGKIKNTCVTETERYV